MDKTSDDSQVKYSNGVLVSTIMDELKSRIKELEGEKRDLARRLYNKAKTARDLLIGYYSPDAIREGWVHLNDVISDLEQIVKEGEGLKKEDIPIADRME